MKAIRPLLFAAAALTLAGCKPSVAPMLELNMLDTQLGEAHNALNGEARACVQHYLDTGDATYATPGHGITLLHLAALTQRLWLVEELLQKGADAKARMRHAKGSDTPLCMALRHYSHEASDPAQDALMVVDRLVQAGAELNDPESANLLGLTALTFRYVHYDDAGRLGMSGEELALALMERGVRGGKAEALAFCRQGWPKALEALLRQSPGNAAFATDGELVHACTDHANEYYNKEGSLACLERLLKAGAPADARDAEGKTALRKLAEGRTDPRSEQESPYIALLLKHGADAMQPTGQYGKATLADLIAADSWMQGALAKQGQSIEAPAHVFEKATVVEQLLDIPERAIRADEVNASLDLLKKLFAEPLHADPLVQRRACARALALMQRERAADALELIESFDWANWDANETFARHLLYAMQETPQRKIYAEWLMHEARGWVAAGRPERAHAFVRLLEFDTAYPNASTCAAQCVVEDGRLARNSRLVDSLCTADNPPAIRAAALSVKLHCMGLPALGNGEVWAWLESKHRLSAQDCPKVLLDAVTADRSAQGLPEAGKPESFEPLNEEHLRRTAAARLREPERLHFTGCTSLHTQQVIAALRAIGANAAADWYAQETPDPAGAAAASLDLETALGLYILAHEQGFREPPSGGSGR